MRWKEHFYVVIFGSLIAFWGVLGYLLDQGLDLNQLILSPITWISINFGIPIFFVIIAFIFIGLVIIGWGMR